MTALLADGNVGIAIKAVVALMALGGFALLALIAILAAVKHRPGIAGLLALGLLLPAGLVFSYVGLRSHQSFNLTPTHSMHSELPIDWTDLHAIHRSVPVWPRIGILLIIGVVITVFTGLSRRGTTNGQHHGRRRWWPVLLVPALLVIAVPLFFMSFAPHRAVNYSRAPAPPQPPAPMVHFSREEDEISQKAARLEATLHRQIA